MRVLAVGAHPDDIELGCGATLIAHRNAGDAITLLVMTSGEQGPQDAQSRVREQEEAADLLRASLLWGGFEDGRVPEGHRAIQVIEKAALAAEADVIYTHAPKDTHQDHRATAIATLAATRRARQILCYESPTSSEFVPGFYVDVEGLVDEKLDLIRCHMSQVLKNGLVDLEAVEAQARFRGFSARVHNGEAFEAHRFTWAITPWQGSDRAFGRTHSTIDIDTDHVTLPEVQIK